MPHLAPQFPRYLLTVLALVFLISSVFTQAQQNAQTPESILAEIKQNSERQLCESYARQLQSRFSGDFTASIGNDQPQVSQIRGIRSLPPDLTTQQRLAEDLRETNPYHTLDDAGIRSFMVNQYERMYEHYSEGRALPLDSFMTQCLNTVNLNHASLQRRGAPQPDSNRALSSSPQPPDSFSGLQNDDTSDTGPRQSSPDTSGSDTNQPNPLRYLR